MYHIIDTTDGSTISTHPDKFLARAEMRRLLSVHWEMVLMDAYSGAVLARVECRRLPFRAYERAKLVGSTRWTTCVLTEWERIVVARVVLASDWYSPAPAGWAAGAWPACLTCNVTDEWTWHHYCWRCMTDAPCTSTLDTP